MGWWKTKNGMIGDWPADIMDEAIRKIEDAYKKQCGRLPTQGEVADLIQFSTCGVLSVLCGDPRQPFSKEKCADDNTPRCHPRGEQGVCGLANKPKPGEMGNVDPKTGDHYEAGEFKQVVEDQFKEREDRGDLPEGGEYETES